MKVAQLVFLYRTPTDLVFHGFYLNKNGFIFGSMYRASSGNIEDFLEVLVKFLDFFK